MNRPRWGLHKYNRNNIFRYFVRVEVSVTVRFYYCFLLGTTPCRCRWISVSLHCLPEGRGCIFLPNASTYLPDYTAS
jgi:hypothetical protein